ncbi:MAG: serine protease AprX [Actinomycetota bacterium]|nr:serine protease AprX [Actinomycetota bacterium]
MHQKLMPLRTIRWGAAVVTAATAVAVCVPAAQAQVLAGSGASASSSATASQQKVAVTKSGFSTYGWGDPKAGSVSKASAPRVSAVATASVPVNVPAEDLGSLYTVEKAIGARDLWTKKDTSGRPLTGKGVSVALLDTGVSEVTGLKNTSKLTFGPDLSIEGNGKLIHQDTYGHGTHMAGIIAGRDTTASSASLPSVGTDVQLGVAPDANLLALKLANTDGSTDVSAVIAALDWVIQYPRTSDGQRVRVINLSYGTDSTQNYLTDPLSAAVENAWKHGIVVVTSAGNSGSLGTRMTNPAINPYVIAVGATQDFKTPAFGASDQTTVAAYSQVGSASRHVDLVAPGTSVVSARVPGSFIDVNYPAGRVAGDVKGTLFRGSGTSQAAAVVSGSIALLLQAYPCLSPDQVKYALTSSARPVKTLTPNAIVNAGGAGSLDLVKAFTVAGKLASLNTRQTFASSTGDGSIDSARGGSFLVDANGQGLTGEIDELGNPWDGAAWFRAASASTSWCGGRWLGKTWTGNGWGPSSPSGAGQWSSARWSSARWSAARWSSTDWSAARWSAARWSTSRWSNVIWK